MTVDQQSTIEQDVETKVVAAVARALDLPPEQIELGASLQEDYGAESLDILEIVFALETAFRIRMPKTNLMQHVQERFGEEKFLHQGQLTDFALRVLRELRPEIDPALFTPGLRVHEVARLVTTQTFVRLALRMVEGKAEALEALRASGCTTCGSHDIGESLAAPEFLCNACGAVYPTPSGDDVLIHDIEALKIDD
ncbi:MAG TPA: phosphopantetheine-binding protein [Thermoanaerobaculia bacterium]|nr:phosphopantetheine-binding protein [Thermoanaerobaculia bacterium]